MTALESMTDKLTKAGLYDPETDTDMYAELSAYAEGLQYCYSMIDELYGEMFAATAESYGLSEMEKNIAVYSKDTTIQGKRNGIGAVLALNDKNGADFIFNRLGEIYNISGTVTDGTKTVTFTTNDALTSAEQEEITSHMQKLMPVNTTFRLIVN